MSLEISFPIPLNSFPEAEKLMFQRPGNQIASISPSRIMDQESPRNISRISSDASTAPAPREKFPVPALGSRSHGSSWKPMAVIFPPPALPLAAHSLLSH